MTSRHQALHRSEENDMKTTKTDTRSGQPQQSISAADPRDDHRGAKCCGDPAPDRSTRSCDLSQGHDGDHWTYAGRTLKWPQIVRTEP